MSRRTAGRLLIGLVVCVAATATAGKAFLNAAFDDFKDEGEHMSLDIAEARRRGVLVTELLAVPELLVVPGGRLRFGQVWVEERFVSTHRFVWLPYEQRLGGYRLSFTLDEGQDLERTGLMFVRDGRADRLRSTWSRGRAVYSVTFDDLDVAGLRLGLAPPGNGPPLEAVRFAPRPQ